MKKISKDSGITLVALVVTIIILLILAGITINSLSGENGLIAKVNQAKKAQIKAEMKETLILAINELQLEKEGKATLDDITQEWANNALDGYNSQITTDASINGKKVTMRKNNVTGKYIIDDKLNVMEVENDSSIEFSYEVKSRTGDKVQIVIYVQDEENGLSKIEFPDREAITVETNKKEEKRIEYEVELKKEYKIKITSENGQAKEEKILITDYWHKITKNIGEGIEIDNTAEKAAYNKPYDANIKVSDGHTVGKLKITMGEQVITEDTSIRTINIEKVTDDIEITIICNPIIISSDEDATTLEVEVKYPEIKNVNTRNQYSFDGINYYGYAGKVTLHDNCIFHARVIDQDTKEVILYSQKEIKNIVYEWGVYRISKSEKWEKEYESPVTMTITDYENAWENEITTIYSSDDLSSHSGYRLNSGTKPEWFVGKCYNAGDNNLYKCLEASYVSRRT